MRSPLPALLSLTVLLAGCADRSVLAPADRATLRGARLRPPGAPLPETLYKDVSSQVALQAGSSFGLVGALVATGVSAGIESAGRAKFRPAVEGQRGAVPGMVARSFGDALRRAGKDAGAPDSEVAITDLGFGVVHKGDQRFAALLSGKVKVSRRDGTVAAERLVAGESGARFTKVEAGNDPRRYRAALEEAAADLAGSAVAGLWGPAVLPEFSARNDAEALRLEQRRVKLQEEEDRRAAAGREQRNAL